MSKPKDVDTALATRQNLLLQELGHDEDYNNYLQTIDPAKRKRIQNHVNRTTTGLHAVAPLMCPGPSKCLFIEHCPIPTRVGSKLVHGPVSDYPIFRPCLLEKLYMEQRVVDYVQHLDVDPQNPFEMAIVQELALIDLYKNRAVMLMSAGDRDGHGQDFMKTDITGFNPETGEKSVTTKLHPATEFVERLEKRRQHWATQLIETRKARADMDAKAGKTGEESNLLQEITLMREMLNHYVSSSPQLLTVDDNPILID